MKINKRQIRGLICAFALSLLACESVGQGGFSLKFNWKDGPPSQESLWITAYVEQGRDDPEVNSKVLDSAGPVKYDPKTGAELQFTRVPIGLNRVFIVEVREFPKTAAPLLYYGISKPVDLIAGKSVVVEVDIELRKTPGAPTDPELAHGAVSVIAPSGFVKTSSVQLRLFTDQATQVKLSNISTFPDDKTQVQGLGTSTGKVIGSYKEYIVDWDLDLGLEPACPKGQLCGRQVYAQFLDAANMPSQTYSATVTVDRQLPRIEDCQFSREVVNRGSVILLSLTSHEPLKQAPIITWEDTDPGFEASGRFESNYTFQKVITSELADDVYTVKGISLVDKSGNTKTATGTGLEKCRSFTVDNVPPDIVNLQVTTTPDYPKLGQVPRVNSGTRIQLQFRVNELYPAEPPSNRPIVKLNEVETPAGCTVEAGAWTCTATVSSLTTTSTETFLPLTINVRDKAGNLSPRGLSVLYDTKPPEIVPSSVHLSYQTHASNVLQSVTAMKADTQAILRVAFNEAVRGLPELEFSSPVVGSTITPQGDRAFTFALVVTSTLPIERSIDIWIHANDLVGNQSRLPLSSIQLYVDTVKPAAPDITNVVYHRRPWGTHDSAGFPEYRLVGNVSPSDEDNLLIAYDGPSEGILLAASGQIRESNEVGRALNWTDSNGDFPDINLIAADRATVHLAQADAAGNLSSDYAEVAKVVWTATLIGKVSGQSLPNPHQIETSATVEENLIQPWSVEPSTNALTDLAEANDGRSLTVNSLPTWRQRIGSLEAPSKRQAHAMAFDRERNKVVLFGGHFNHQDTWEWDGVSWVERVPTTIPPGRYSHAMTYDALRRRVLMFGGVAGLAGLYSDTFADTWEWDGNNWSQAIPLHAPPRRQGHSMVYDEARGRVVLFGGFTTSPDQVYGDTWEWDGHDWTLREVSNPPPPRSNHAMAYDQIRNRVVLFGGHDLNTTYQDTWEWDGNDWTSVQSSTSPSARSSHAMVFEETRGRVLMFAGSSESGASFDDTWEWDGQNWTEHPTNSGPYRRFGHPMTYDRKRKRVVLNGGRAHFDFLEDTWEWDGNRWNSRAHVSGRDPLTWTRHKIIYDPSEGRVLHSAGADMYEWKGINWLTLASPNAAPSSRTSYAMSFDVSRGELVLFGGSTTVGPTGRRNDTWTWDGTEWAEAPFPVGVSPSARANHAMAYDEARERTVLFGGYGYDPRTWEWDGTQWTERVPSNSPTPRRDHMLAYDAAGRRVVLLGGRDSANDLIEEMWAWDGTEWSELNPTHLPDLNTVEAMSYDSDRHRLVCLAIDQNSHSVWEFNGVDWIERATNNPPRARDSYAMTYDVARNELVLDGGQNASGNFGDTWTLDSSANLRSAMIMSVDWSEALAQAGDIDRISGFSSVGGRGYTTTATAIAGSEVLVWDAYATRWKPWASNSADRSAPTSLSFTTATRPEAQRLVDHNEKIHLRFQPSTGMGRSDDLAGLSLDYVEVTVHYTIGTTETATCGDGRIDLIPVDASRFPELCDDGNTLDGDGCASTCIRETSYSCSGEPSVCVQCGDTFIEGLETCDDGNFINGDGCNEVCQVEYGYTCTSTTPSACTIP